MSRARGPLAWGLASIAAFLSACAGMSGNPPVVTLSGVASEGLALSNRVVVLQDARGRTRTGITDESGAFTFEAPGLTYPVVLWIQGTQGVHHSLYTADDAGKPANVSDDTDAIAQLALGVTRSGLQAAVQSRSFASVTGASLGAAEALFLQRVKSEFDGVGALLTGSPRTRAFTPGTKPGDGDAFAQLMGNVSYTADGKGGLVSLDRKPGVIREISRTAYDGASDDLLTGGLGKTGMMGAAPAFADPAKPTSAELRRNAIYLNYRSLLDPTIAGGFGTLYGPNVDANGNATSSEGRIAGVEYIAYADDGSGRKNVTLMVQIPSTFDPQRPCIVTGTSSGSRGVYGHIGATGDWGLKRGCAVAYSDKGSGNGMHDLQNDTVSRIDGVRTTASEAGKASHFTAPLTAAERAAFNAATPNRVAFKHAHSRQNPERDWGRNTLDSVLFAFHVLNEQFAPQDASGARLRTIVPANTLVIAAGVSNGGGAALAAAEQDELGLIDGVVVSEPQIQVGSNGGLTIEQGSQVVPVHSRPLLDLNTFASLYQPCAALAEAAAGSPGAALLSSAGSANRCAALRAKGLLNGETTAEQANDALARILAYGWPADAAILNVSHYRLATTGVVATYTNAYGRFSVTDNLCGFSFGATDGSGAPAPQSPVAQASAFATANGLPPTTGANIIYNDAVGGPRLDLLAVSPGTNLQDFALDGALCQRSLVTGTDPVTGAPLTGAALERSNRVRAGMAEVLATGKLRGKPTLLVHGRADTLVPTNHSSRAYYGKTLMVEGTGSRARYYEITNAQHFDAFIGSPAVAGYDTRFVPLHRYFAQSLDLMFDALRNQKELPPSQVVRTIPRGGAPGQAPPLTAANVPPIPTAPADGDRITFSDDTLTIPD